jgi:hypothetical protein
VEPWIERNWRAKASSLLFKKIPSSFFFLLFSFVPFNSANLSIADFGEKREEGILSLHPSG